jgi:uncharacterized protein DUF4304
MNTSQLKRLFDAALSPAGFRRRKDSWYRLNEDVITVVNLQKSQWGGQFYINLGIYLRVLGNSISPPEYQCHVRARLTAIAGDRMSPIEAALDLEGKEMPMEEREGILRRSLEEIALPFLNDRSTVPQLRGLHAKGQLERGAVSITKAARALLEQAPL